MEDVVLSALGIATVAVLLIETMLVPGSREAVRIPDNDTERYLKSRSDRYLD